MIKPTLALLIAVLLSSCASTSQTRVLSGKGESFSYPSSAALEKPGTSLELAAYRSALIQSPHYEVWLGFDETRSDFQGRLSLKFTIPANRFELIDDRGIPLDFESGQIHSLKLNGSFIPAPQVASLYDQKKLHLPKSGLRKGLNQIEVQFEHASSAGLGLQRFKDPADSRVYWFSSFKNDGLQLILPSFDQPNLQSTFELTVDVPENWVVVSYAMEKEVSPVGRQERWVFAESLPMSPRKFSLAVGPFQEWSSEAEGVPLRILARQSLGERVPAGAWFELSEGGIHQLIEEVENPFPFPKLDQIFVPTSHASTHQSTTFLPEALLNTPAKKEYFLNVTHTLYTEFSKAWFGNLLTPRWHNTQWMEDSLSRHLGILAVSRATRYGNEAWSMLPNPRSKTEKRPLHFHRSVQHSRNESLPDQFLQSDAPLFMCFLRQEIGPEKWSRFLQTLTTRYARKNLTLGDFVFTLQQTGEKKDLYARLRPYLSGSPLPESVRCDIPAKSK